MTTHRRKGNWFRLGGKLLRGLGFLAGTVSAIGLIVAAALPWAQLTVLQTPIHISGILAGVGIITASIGLLMLAQFRLWRRFPVFGMLLGGIACYVGSRAEAESGLMVRKYLLETQIKLVPINRRLTQVGLPPIEPTGSGIGPRRDYTGVGTTWTARAGAGVAASSLFLLVAELLIRTCPHCRRTWSAKRGEDINFCPACGITVAADPICPRCAEAVLPGEKFCVHCGEELRKPGNKSKTTAVV